MEQLQSILTDLENKEITKHQAYDLILVLFDVSKNEVAVCCPKCKYYDSKYDRYCDDCTKFTKFEAAN